MIQKSRYMKLRDILNWGADTLQMAGVDEAGLDAWYLLSYCMGINKAQYYMMQEDEIAEDLHGKYTELIYKRSERMPLQYITHSQEFMGLDFEVDENVLIPRQDTEILVELALGHCAGKNVLDMCTGSGCIAVSIAKLGEPASVTASDISKGALCVAVKNASNNEVSVSFIESDLWENIDEKYDVLVSNPPYITAEEMKELMPEVGMHEPTLALYGGNDGLDIYKRIIGEAAEHINNGGYIFLEIGCKQGQSVSDILNENGFTAVKVEKDLAGLDRVVWGWKK